MREDYRKICSWVDERRDEMMAKFEELIRIESHSEEKENVKKAQDWAQRELEAEGFACRTEGTTRERMGLLIGELGMERPGGPVVLGGHLDTVHRQGSFGERVWKVDGDTVYGPGVNDMKGGIIEAIYVIKALNALGFKDRPIRVLFAGDEESDHTGTEVDELYGLYSKGACAGFNFEIGIDGLLTVARKSCHMFSIHIDGIGGHAGNDFTTSANAAEEAALKICEMRKISDVDKGTFVTTTVLNSGFHDSAIPNSADMMINARVSSAEEKARLYAEMERITAASYIEGTRSTCSAYAAKFEGYNETPKIAALLDHVNRVAKEIGMPPFGKCFRSGAADSGNMMKADIPVLCSCGVVGERSHDPGESAYIHTLFERTRLFACAIWSIGDFRA